MEAELNLNEIVKIEQMPKVFEQLELIGEFITEKLNWIYVKFLDTFLWTNY